MTNRTMYSCTLILLVAAICSSGCYRTVATVSIDKSNKFVVTEEKAKEGEMPSVVETEDGGQTLQIDEGYNLRVRARNQEFPDGQLSIDGPSSLSLDSGAQLTIEDGLGSHHNYMSDDLDQIRVRKYYFAPTIVGLGVWMTVTGIFGLGPGVFMMFDDDFGPPFLGGSAVLIGAGIPLWLLGKRGIVDVSAYRRRLKKTGVGLTVFGIVTATTSLVFIAAFSADGFGIDESIAGIFILGVSPLSIGIPMWAVNKRRMERGEKNSAALPMPTVMVSPETNTYGLGLRWRL